MPEYVLKWRSEATWGAIVAALTYLATAAADPDIVANWDKPAHWVPALVAGLIRVTLGAVAASMTGGFRPGIPVGPQQPTIDEAIGVSPRAIATPEMPAPDTSPPAVTSPPTGDRPYDPRAGLRDRDWPNGPAAER